MSRYVILVGVLLTAVQGYGVISSNRYDYYSQGLSSCSLDLYTTYYNYVMCPCGTVIVCSGCPTGCCCPVTSSTTEAPPPPPPPPMPEENSSSKLAFFPSLLFLMSFFIFAL
ncbi:unnamed protein product [Heligmosomoides polygyrus]|uniref:CX domain-containing protein n=1 Tax=Heligmosomoides polygyrus TaxID=6339 RepID=A0A183FJF6_HELPZ|nr:unnamed protein product [Heligmosomoides polygyrus]